MPIPYSEETMYGFEYQVASHMIQEGFVDEGLEIVRAVRDKFDGEKRNPWNEFECGSNYARSMSSYALLNSFSGLSFDMTRKRIGFAPICPFVDFSVFWCLGTGWGRFELTPDSMKLRVLYGRITLTELGIPLKGGRTVSTVTLDGREVVFHSCGESISFTNDITIGLDSCLTILCSRC